MIWASDKPNNKESFPICRGSNVEYECFLKEISKSKLTNDDNIFVSIHLGFLTAQFYRMEHKWFLPAEARIELNGKINTLKIKIRQGVFEVCGNDDVYTKIIKTPNKTDREYKLKGFQIELDKEGEKQATKAVVYDEDFVYEYFMRLNYKKEKHFNVFNGEFTVDKELLEEYPFSDFYSFSSYYYTKEKRFTFVGKYENSFPVEKSPYLIVPSDALYDCVVKQSSFYNMLGIFNPYFLVNGF